jgi:hypothetical protein
MNWRRSMSIARMTIPNMLFRLTKSIVLTMFGWQNRRMVLISSMAESLLSINFTAAIPSHLESVHSHTSEARPRNRRRLRLKEEGHEGILWARRLFFSLIFQGLFYSFIFQGLFYSLISHMLMIFLINFTGNIETEMILKMVMKRK